MSEGTEVYHRLNSLEREVHTLNFRMEALEEANLTNRVLSLEGLVGQIGKDVTRIETTAETIRDDVRDMKSWGKGALAAAVGLITLVSVPFIMELFK